MCSGKLISSASLGVLPVFVRRALLDEQISRHSNQAGQLAQALSSLLPHVHSNDCPVCNRNFGEVSTTPLVGHLATNISSLTEAAGRLAALSQERADTNVGVVQPRIDAGG